MSDAPTDLYCELLRCCTQISKPRSSVLFGRGEEAFGVFVVLCGQVILDFGIDSPGAMAITCGPGALVGLPACLTKGRYRMNATVAKDAVLGFLAIGEFFSLLRTHPELYPQLLTILSDRLEQAQKMQKAAMWPGGAVRLQLPSERPIF